MRYVVGAGECHAMQYAGDMLSRPSVSGVRRQEDDMAKYMWTGSYTLEGTKGLIAEGGSARRAVIEKMMASMGGKLECMYFSFGSDDVLIIVDAPDNVSAAAVALTVAGSGAVRGKMTVLLTPEEVDKATKKTPAYRAPGA
jgi:uncharacterized protein with GYD domain